MREENQEQLMKDISERIKKIRAYTPKVGVFGNSGVGKSSLCNALFGKDIAKVSDVKAGTRTAQEIHIGADDNNGGIKLIDLPGIGEDPERHKEYTELYNRLAPTLDLVLWAIKADDRNYASGLDTYRSIFAQGKDAPPVIFVITQADKTSVAKDWNHQDYKPEGRQLPKIIEKEHEVSGKFGSSTANIVSIAVEVEDEKLTGKSYNLDTLVERVVEALPNAKKYSFTREAKEENVSQHARESAEKGILEEIKEWVGDQWEKVRDKAIGVLIASAPKIISSTFKWLKSWF